MTDVAQMDGEIDVSLEAVELELALQLQDVVESGFENNVQSAVEAAGYRFLFQFPAELDDELQRVAAICTGDGEQRRILLVHLTDDGQTLRVDAPDEEENSIAGFAASYAGLMDYLAGTTIAA